MVEHAIGLARNVPEAQQVQVMKVVGVAETEIVVADIAAADHCSIAIHDHQLVVHTTVQPFHLCDHLRAS